MCAFIWDGLAASHFYKEDRQTSGVGRESMTCQSIASMPNVHYYIVRSVALAQRA